MLLLLPRPAPCDTPARRSDRQSGRRAGVDDWSGIPTARAWHGTGCDDAHLDLHECVQLPCEPRAPIGERSLLWAYRPGKFLNASLDKASVDNERNALAIEMEDGRMLAVVQIAGLVARRIVCDVAEGRSIATGERFGMIRFGSRLDVYLPAGASPLVSLGQTMVAGEGRCWPISPRPRGSAPVWSANGRGATRTVCRSCNCCRMRSRFLPFVPG